MRTKLSLFFDKLIEAGWLAAVVMVPTLFSVYTNDRFEVNKVSLVRSLALVMSLAWVVRTVERWRVSREVETEVSPGRGLREFLARPLVLPALLTIGITLLSTAVSIWPHGSLWGAYDRRQGALTTLSYVVIGILLLRLLRTEGQLERLVTGVVLGSVPVCLYGLGQHLDLVPAILDVNFAGGRVPSSLGNPIFLGAYLVMVVPVTLRQLLRSLRRILACRRRLLSGLWGAGLYGALLATQLYVVVLTQSRGPFLALLVGLTFFFLLWSLQQDRRSIGLVVVVLAMLAGSFLVAVNVCDVLSNALRDLPHVGRLTTLSGPGVLRTRTLIWQGAVDLSCDDPLRLVLGYGPESMDLAFYGHYPPELVALSGPEKTADRSHNAILDALVSTGLVGSAIYLFLFCSLFTYGLHVLGLVGEERQRRAFAALLGGGGILGFSAAWLVGGLGFVSIGVSAGLLAGLLTHILLFLLGIMERRAAGGRHQLLVIALLSALVAHFVEIQAGIPVTATRLTFWVFAGVMASVVARPEPRAQAIEHAISVPHASGAEGLDEPATCEDDGAATSSAARLLEPEVARVLPGGLLVGLLLISVAFGFVTHRSDLRGEPFTVVFLLLVWLVAGLIVLGEAGAPGSGQENALGWLDRLFIYAVPSLLSSFIFATLHLFVLNRYPAITAIPVVYYVVSFGVLTAAGIALMGDSLLPDRFWRSDRGWLHPILILAVIGLVVTTNLNLVRADVCCHLGRLYEGTDRLDRSIGWYERAVSLAPMQDRYYNFLGRTYLKRAKPRTSQRPVWLRRAEAAFKRAVQISPLNPDHRGNLGNMYHAWADVTTEPGPKAMRLEKALMHYQESVDLAPQTHGHLLEDAIFEAHVSLANTYGQLGRAGAAMEQARAAWETAPDGREEEAERLIATLKERAQ